MNKLTETIALIASALYVLIAGPLLLIIVVVLMLYAFASNEVAFQKAKQGWPT